MILRRLHLVLLAVLPSLPLTAQPTDVPKAARVDPLRCAVHVATTSPDVLERIETLLRVVDAFAEVDRKEESSTTLCAAYEEFAQSARSLEGRNTLAVMIARRFNRIGFAADARILLDEVYTDACRQMALRVPNPTEQRRDDNWSSLLPDLVGAYARVGAFDQATRVMDLVDKLYPAPYSMHYNLSEFYSHEERTRHLLLYTRAACFGEIALAHESAGRHDDAIRTMVDLLVSARANGGDTLAGVRYMLSEYSDSLRLELGRADRLQQYDMALRTARLRTTTEELELAEAYLDIGDSTRARRWVWSLVVFNPDLQSGSLLLDGRLLARIYARLGQFDSAEYFARQSEFDPSQGDAYSDIGDELARRGEQQRARINYRLAIGSSREDTVLRYGVSMLSRPAIGLYRSGDVEGGVSGLELELELALHGGQSDAVVRLIEAGKGYASLGIEPSERARQLLRAIATKWAIRAED